MKCEGLGICEGQGDILIRGDQYACGINFNYLEICEMGRGWGGVGR